mmetsp:Transcript_20639/g.29629  ORF Transcript_20639/g.29629 Transcript_20639/m.29629 type:complete len:306 (-) Transcript_20639:134-1051(-)
MSEDGVNVDSIPEKFEKILDFIPEEEEVVYWLNAKNSDFWEYFSYINNETFWSCPPFSFVFACCNAFNLPCLYADYKNNSNKILIGTDESLIVGSLDDTSCCCCFSPNFHATADVYSWKHIKFIGSKQEFEQKKQNHDSSFSCLPRTVFLRKPMDVLLVAKRTKENVSRGIWLDFVEDSDARIGEIKALRSRLKSRRRVVQRKSKGHMQLVELGTSASQRTSEYSEGSSTPEPSPNRMTRAPIPRLKEGSPTPNPVNTEEKVEDEVLSSSSEDSYKDDEGNDRESTHDDVNTIDLYSDKKDSSRI